MACRTLARQAAVLQGLTMPVVPRIEMPPRMPRRALSVLRDLFAARHRELDSQAAGVEQVACFGCHMLRDHAARDGVDGWPADVEAQAGSGHDTDSAPAGEVQPGLVAPRDRRDDLGPVRGVGIVTSVLDHPIARLLLAELTASQGKGRIAAGREMDRHPLHGLLTDERARRAERGSRGAGAGSEALAHAAPPLGRGALSLCVSHRRPRRQAAAAH